MWEEYKAKDGRIIRPVDGNEFFATSIYLNVTDVFPKFSIEEFKQKAQENLSKINVFNYAIKRIDGKFFWIRKKFEMHLEEVEWTENEEIENHLKNEDKIIIPYVPILEEEGHDVHVLYSFKACQLKISNQTKLTFTVMHAISDGRTAFYMFDLIRRVINGETLEKNDEALYSYGGRERFQNLDESFEMPPPVWNEIQPLQILPKLPDPIQYITIHYIYDYAPISKFCKENGISVQAMLIAMMTRATRKYKHLSKETKLWNSSPCDTRTSPYATEEFKKHQFFNNASSIHPGVVGQDTLMGDLKHCMEKLLEAKATHDDVRQLCCCANIINPQTLQFMPTVKFPNIHNHAVVNTSNIGFVNGNMPLFYLTNTTMFGMYNFFYHSYHTTDKLFISGLMPINMDKSYTDAIKEEMDKIFIPENISKY